MSPQIAGYAAKLRTTSTGYADDGGLVSEAASALEAAGLTVLGNGSYGVAATVGNGRVLKFSLSEEDPWRKWITLDRDTVPAHIREHLPVVYDVAEIGSVFVAEIERLYDDPPYGGYGVLPPEVREWATLRRPPGARDDFHVGHNIMYRFDGTAVLTDPWAHVAGWGASYRA